MENDPEYFFCLRYKICSSFPLQQMISFHKKKEQDAETAFLERKKFLELDGGEASLNKLKKLKVVRPLMTLMGVQRQNRCGTVQGGTFVIEG